VIAQYHSNRPYWLRQSLRSPARHRGQIAGITAKRVTVRCSVTFHNGSATLIQWFSHAGCAPLSVHASKLFVLVFNKTRRQLIVLLDGFKSNRSSVSRSNGANWESIS
jgi:hypothetical protein